MNYANFREWRQIRAMEIRYRWWSLRDSGTYTYSRFSPGGRRLITKTYRHGRKVNEEER